MHQRALEDLRAPLASPKAISERDVNAMIVPGSGL